MPKYLVLEKSFINNRIYEAGEECEYEGPGGSNLELVKGETPYQEPKPKDTEAEAKAKAVADAKLKADAVAAEAKGRDEHGHPRPGDKPLA